MKVCARDQKALAARAKGRDYQSEANVKHGLWLLGELRAGRIKEFEYEKRWELFSCQVATPQIVISEGGRISVDRNEPFGPTKTVGHHKPDFTVWLKDGRVEVHEVKWGRATQTEAWHLRRKIFEANYPWCRYRVFEFGSEKRKWFIQLEDE